MRIRPFLRLAVLLAPGLAAGCGGTGSADLAQTLGMVRDAPDEFEVTTRAPLAIPSNFDILPPPRPGAPRPQEQSARLAAEATLAPQTVLASGNGPDSPGQRALDRAAGPAPPRDIRARIEKEAAKDSDETLTGQLMFWKDAPPPGTSVDPKREAARLRRRGVNAPAPAAATAPAPAPSAGEKGLLDRIF